MSAGRVLSNFSVGTPCHFACVQVHAQRAMSKVQYSLIVCCLPVSRETKCLLVGHPPQLTHSTRVVVWCCAGVFAVLAFVQAVAWLNLSASGLVQVCVVVGTIFGLKPALLGATVLAWGNSVPDLVNNVAMARDGFPSMAVAACFASPLFTLLVGMGGALAYGGCEDGCWTHGRAGGAVWRDVVPSRSKCCSPLAAAPILSLLHLAVSAAIHASMLLTCVLHRMCVLC